jgi:uncharacterized protein YndB with AHSA1/START domain
MTTTTPQLFLTHIVAASRGRVFQAFTDPEHFAGWWGPFGNSLHDVDFDVRPGGLLRWSETFPDEPEIWTHGSIDLTEVVDGELLDGVMRIAGNLPGAFEPFESRMRIEFYDESNDSTRLEIRQWLPETHVSPSEGGWGEALSKLDTMLASGAE